MKKVYILILLTIVFLTTGCLKRYNMEDINVITTIYPIEYVTKRLYGDKSNVSSIYPRGSTTESYVITKKQLKDFSSYDLFIYNGESKEREYATSMLNINKELKIIDASYGLEATNLPSDVWLDPSNILMIAQNIKNELKEYISNPYLVEEIEEKYESLKVDVSGLETELKKTADNSIDKRIITTDESLLFLEKYGFTIINLKENNKDNDTNINLAKSLLSNKQLSYVFIHENDEDNQVVEDLVKNYKAQTLTFKTMSLITEEDISSNEDYLSIMNDNINALKEETYK